MTKPLTGRQKQLLNQVYHKDRVLFGRDKLYMYVRTYYPQYSISRRQIMEYLKNQNVHQLYKQSKKTKDIQPTILKHQLLQVGADLIDMQNYEYRGYNYILTAVDLFSKYAWAIPLKGKTAKSVTAGMRKMLKSMNKLIPKSIRSDNGSEFISASFKDLMRQFQIRQVFSNVRTPQSNGGVERFNRTLKELIKMDRTQNDTNNWVAILPTLVRNYNNVQHSVTKMIPSDLHFTKNTVMINKAYENMMKRLGHAVVAIPVFKRGDKVRLKIKVPKNYKKDNIWTDKIYEIYKVLKPRKIFVKPHYFVSDGDTKFKDKLYEEDLQKIDKVENKVKRPRKFIISKIINKKVDRGKTFYEVKWLGYNETSWEPEENLKRDVPKMLKAFNKAV